MANVKITALPAATLPLVGTEVFEVVQSTLSKKVAASDIAAAFSTDPANILPVTAGGTGVATLTTGYLLKGAGTAVVTASILFDNGTSIGLGTASPNASAILDVQSTTKGLRLPNMTTTQKNAIASPAAGLMIFDTTLGKACIYTGSAWQTITSA